MNERRTAVAGKARDNLRRIGIDPESGIRRRFCAINLSPGGGVDDEIGRTSFKIAGRVSVAAMSTSRRSSAVTAPSGRSVR